MFARFTNVAKVIDTKADEFISIVELQLLYKTTALLVRPLHTQFTISPAESVTDI